MYDALIGGMFCVLKKYKYSSQNNLYVRIYITTHSISLVWQCGGGKLAAAAEIVV